MRTAAKIPPMNNRQHPVAGKTVADFPAAARQFDLKRNAPLRPETVAAGSDRCYWWRCPKGPDHVWTRTATYQTRYATCSFCTGHQLSVTNSLAALFPNAAAEWHPTKNGALMPDQVLAGKRSKAWWKCPAGPDHEWEARIWSRGSGGAGCPFCAGVRVSVTNSLATLRPDLAEEWHPTRNGKKTPAQVTTGMSLRAWWRCVKVPSHPLWQSRISHRMVGRGCPACAAKRIVVRRAEVAPERALAAARPELAAQWHPTKNRPLSPAVITIGSDRKIWWRCPRNPSHVWQAAVSNRTGAQAQGCPDCAYLDRIVIQAPRRALIARKARGPLSTRYPELLRLWHPTKNGSLTLADVPTTGDRVWWRCPNGPDHEWEGTISSRITSGASCPFCSHKRVSVTNCLATLFPTVAKEWHPTLNGSDTPMIITAKNSKSVWWKCQFGHVWKTIIANRTRLGSGCPVCARGHGRKTVMTGKRRRGARMSSYDGPKASAVRSVTR